MDIQRHNTILLHASACGNLKEVKSALLANADINTQDHHESTPLILAARNNHLEIVKHLLEQGADVDAYEFPEDQKYTTYNGQTASIYAVLNNNLAMLQLLFEYNASSNMADGVDQTLLSYAVQKNYPAMVKVLLENHANLDLGDFNGYMPLDYAIEDELIESMVEILNARPDYHNYALERATQKNKKNVLAFFDKINEQQSLEDLITNQQTSTHLSF